MSQAEGNLTQTQQGNQEMVSRQVLTATDVVKLLSEIETLVQQSALSETDKGKAITYIAAAKEEVEQKRPDKELVAKNLKRAGDTIKTASETVEAAKKLWETIQKILPPIATWLGVARSLLGF
ncbi:MAG: hypothetical protein HC866_05090 [Leptolyngbyaceae cyanobacterium RU_5_1]|nr:hypothetical protein [Leptolyngbyaceae cyanobacterium RU_5_1]